MQSRFSSTLCISRVAGKTLDFVSGGLNTDIRAPPSDHHAGWVHSQAVHERAELVAHASALLAEQDSKRPKKPHKQKRRVRAEAHPEPTRHVWTLIQDRREYSLTRCRVEGVITPRVLQAIGLDTMTDQRAKTS